MKTYLLKMNDNQHRQLKVKAYEAGMTIKDFVLSTCLRSNAIQPKQVSSQPQAGTLDKNISVGF